MLALRRCWWRRSIRPQAVVNNIAAIGEAMRAARHEALLMVDAVASLGCMPFDMDEWGVDVAMAGSQKGLMTPPGARLRGCW
jgi:alanine-glyoxylate transaminase / serine-glyoxylate transaminase / serine-pyruvate transaminase